jgi:hypothetical protein
MLTVFVDNGSFEFPKPKDSISSTGSLYGDMTEKSVFDKKYSEISFLLT